MQMLFLQHQIHQIQVKILQVTAAAKVVGAGTGNRYFIDGVQQKTLVVKLVKLINFLILLLIHLNFQLLQMVLMQVVRIYNWCNGVGTNEVTISYAKFF